MKRRRFLKIFGVASAMLGMGNVILPKNKRRGFFLVNEHRFKSNDMEKSLNAFTKDIPIGSLAFDKTIHQWYLYRGKKWDNWCTIE